MPYIKSKTNYVLKSKHQDTNDGKSILERDMATIGGVVRVQDNKIPIYKSGNFVITSPTINNYEKDYGNSLSWIGDGESEFWTSESPALQEGDDIVDSSQPTIRQDYYSLADFSYYGSCSELIRASINDIVKRFPGELYFSETKAVYYNKQDHKQDDEGGEKINTLYLVDNPCSIDIHSKYIDPSLIEDKLKYFCQDGYKNYELIANNGKVYNITQVEYNFDYGDDCQEIGAPYKALKGKNKVNAKVTIKYKGSRSTLTLKIYLYVGTNNTLLYLHNNVGWHIRPKQKFISQFYNSLDNFQQILLNRDSHPKYTAILEVLKENDYGYIQTLEKFTWPMAMGGYNIAATPELYSNYLSRLASLANIYDELYCDNLWKNMTHEAIKNFDWTFTRRYVDGEEEPYVEGGSKIQKLIRLLGREFDEIKSYIDGIKYANVVTYDGINNTSDYVLTDLLESNGIDVLNIYPTLLAEENTPSTQADETSIPKNTLKKFNLTFDTSTVIHPYNEMGDCWKREWNTENCKEYAPYSSTTEYTMNDVNNHFMKMLQLNARHVFSHKGTIEGIEMILGMFGLRSKRWVDGLSNLQKERLCNLNSWDYEITEKIVQASPLTDNWNNCYGLDRINEKKTIVYNTVAFMNGEYEHYQGLPIKYRENGDGTCTLYPYFSKDKPYDGGLYYQMYGGWLHKKPFTFTKDNVYIETSDIDLFKETLSHIESVNTIKDLIEVPLSRLSDGSVVKVIDPSQPYIVIDGVLYDVYWEKVMPQTFKTSSMKETKEAVFGVANDDNTPKYYHFIKVYTRGSQVKIGKTVFYNTLYVTDPIRGVEVDMGNNVKYNINAHPINQYANNTEIRIYLTTGLEMSSLTQDNIQMMVYDESQVINNCVYFEGFDKPTYFQVRKAERKFDFGGDGWGELKEDCPLYHLLQLQENYFKGNNPHASLTVSYYDGGERYLECLNKPLTYALENDEFNHSAFGEPLNYYSAMTSAETYSFGMSTNSSSGNGCSKEEYNYQNSNKISSVTDSGSEAEIDLQVNTKMVDITFNCKSFLENNNKWNQRKYYDYVISHYLTQLIPSSLIVYINFNEENATTNTNV